MEIFICLGEHTIKNIYTQLHMKFKYQKVILSMMFLSLFNVTKLPTSKLYTSDISLISMFISFHYFLNLILFKTLGVETFIRPKQRMGRKFG